MILDQAPERIPVTRATTKPRKAARARAANPAGAALDSIWRFFCSVRVAVILILLIAAASLAGTLLMQAPAGVSPGTPEYEAWLTGVRTRYGGWTDILSTLQLLNVFRVWWFKGLLGWLAISTVVCSINRWPGISRQVFSPRVRRPDSFFERARVRAALSSPVDLTATAQLFRRAARARGYRVVAEEGQGAVHLYADKHRLARLGTYLTHTSLVLFLVGAVASGALGFSNTGFVVPEGTTREVGAGTGLSVQAVSFADEYYPEGPPKDYRSELILYRDGVEVKRGTIRVNEPMKYRGVRFFQSFYGPAAYLQITDAAGNVVFDDGVALAWKARGERPAGSFPLSLPGRELTVYVVGPAAGQADPLVRPGEMHLEVYQGTGGAPVAIDRIAQGETRELAGLKITFVRERQFTGLQVSKDPGAPLIWFAGVMLVVGLVTTLGVRHRQVWAVARATPDGATRLLLATAGRRDAGFADEFEALVTRVHAAVAVATVTDPRLTGAARSEEAAHV